MQQRVLTTDDPELAAIRERDAKAYGRELRCGITPPGAHDRRELLSRLDAAEREIAATRAEVERLRRELGEVLHLERIASKPMTTDMANAVEREWAAWLDRARSLLERTAEDGGEGG